MVTPAQRRRAVRHVMQALHVPERAACRAVNQPRSTQRYQAQQRNGEVELVKQLQELALRFPRFGYRRMQVMLRRDGWRCNRKRVQRLWRQHGFKVPQKQRKHRRSSVGSSDNAITRRRAQAIDQVWSFDFCHERTADGRALKIFSVIDEFTRRCLAIVPRRSISGGDVAELLRELMNEHGVPRHVRCDNGPEFVCKAVRRWLSAAKVMPLYIEPGSPWENGCVESYHARLRDEMLNGAEFGSVEEAAVLLEDWREQYNHERPHGALGYQTPMAFAAACRSAQADSATLRRPGQNEEESMNEYRAAAGTKVGV